MRIYEKLLTLFFIFLCFPFCSNAYPSDIFAGAASVSIPTTLGAPFGAWKKQIENTRPDDKLKVTALVLKSGSTKVAILSVDLTYVYNGGLQGQEGLRQADDLKDFAAKRNIENVMIVATHNHAAPARLHDEGDKLKVLFEEALSRADRNLEPAEYRLFNTEAETSFNRIVRRKEPSGDWSGTIEDWVRGHGEWTKNSVIGLRKWREEHKDDPYDDTISGMHIRSLSGRTIATIWNYASHAVTHGMDNTTASGDYPGLVRRSIKEEIGGEVLFLQGAAGDIDPWQGLDSGSKAFDNARGMAGIISDAIIGSILSGENNYKSQGDITVMPYSFGSRNRTIVVNDDAVQENNMPKIFYFDIFVLRLGETFITFVPGEFYLSYELELKKYLSEHVKGGQLIFVGYTNEAFGYIPEKIIHNKGRGKEVHSINYNKGSMVVSSKFGEMVMERLKHLILQGSPSRAQPVLRRIK